MATGRRALWDRSIPERRVRCVRAEAAAKLIQEFSRLLLDPVTFFRALTAVRRACALLLAAVLLLAASTAGARTVKHSLHSKHGQARIKWEMQPDVNLPDAGYVSSDMPEPGEGYELKLTRRTGETLDVVYRIGDIYIPEVLADLSLFLRDSHNDEVKSYDPRIFDLLHTMLKKINRSSSEIEVLCGYRSQETNDALRRSHTTNAAKHSQHIEATAIDMRVPGVPAAELRDAALELGAGGVGYYPRGEFVHVDTGRVRKWVFVRRRGKHTHRRRHS